MTLPLHPGERLVGGELLYSAAWLNTSADDDLAFAHACIADLQHLVRELRHEIANYESPLAVTR